MEKEKNMVQFSEKTALIVVDIQKDFCPGGTLAVNSGDNVIPVINQLSPLFHYVIATQDWHPPGHVSFASTYPDKKPFESIKIGDIEQTLWPDHCIQGTEGADIHPGLNTKPFNLILRKGTNKNIDSYSAFFENDRITSTGLEHYLKGLGIKHVYVCGLATDVCVFYTVIDSLRLGFMTFLIEDASKGVDVPKGSLIKAIENMKKQGAKVLTSQNII